MPTFFALLLFGSIFLFSYDVSRGWFPAGSEPEKYEMGVDKKAGMNGSKSAIIRSKTNKATGFGTLMQIMAPGQYLGKRIKMSGYMRSEHVDDWAGFWLRVDSKGGKETLAFDNMYDRNVNGTTGWKLYEIELNVPEKAGNIAFGALLTGPGAIWFDDIKFEIANK